MTGPRSRHMIRFLRRETYPGKSSPRWRSSGGGWWTCRFGVARRRDRPSARGGFLAAIAVLLTLCLAQFESRATAEPVDESHSPGEPLRTDRFRWNFGRQDDTNFDDWPDGWQRRGGPRYPGYVDIAITAKNTKLERQLQNLDTSLVRYWTNLRRQLVDTVDSRPEIADWLASPEWKWGVQGLWLAAQTPAIPTWIRAWTVLETQVHKWPTLPPSISDAWVDRFLRIELDGGLALVQSPSVTCSHVFQYRFRCDVMTQGLRHDRVYAELVFLDDTKDILATHRTEHVSGDTPWTTLMIDHLVPPNQATAMLVRLVVDSADDGLEDIRGTIGFDNIVIEQFPQLQIVTDEPLGIYEVGRRVVSTATLMGLPANSERVRFHVYDHQFRLITTETVPFQPSDRGLQAPVVSNRSEVPESDAVNTQSRPDRTSVDWTLPPLEAGFYRIAASLVSGAEESLATETSIAMIDRLVSLKPPIPGESPPPGPHGAFGWTLPRGAAGLEPRELAQWLKQCGVAWLKYPCWLAPDDVDAAERTVALLAKLEESDIRPIGMLDVPPESELAVYEVRGRQDLVAAHLFRQREIWQPRLEPVMSRLTLKVRTWQLGGDRDYSFLGRIQVRDSIAEISTGLQGYGQPIDVALPWPWLEPDLPPSEVSWQTVCRSGDPPLSADEMDKFLGLKLQDARVEGPRTWLLVDPVSQQSYTLSDRITDLVLRMATVRKHRVQAAFVSDPHDPDSGLLRSDGRPAEMLLPWRTTSLLIGNLRHMGSLQLRCGANNLVLTGAGRAVVIVWSAQPTEELIFLGEEAKLVDVWGRVQALETETVDGQIVQRVPVGTLPRFIVDADPVVLALRMSVEAEPNQLDSVLGRPQSMTVHFANPTSQSLFGRIRIGSPPAWIITDHEQDWELLSGHSARHDIAVTLSNTAKVGEYELPIQFDLQSTPSKSFTVYRKVTVGPQGLTLTATTRLLPNGELLVTIEMTNQSTRTQSYDCMLFPPGGRQYLRRLVVIEPGETIQREFNLEHGSPLIGKRMLFRAAEEDGLRILNYELDIRK